MSLIGADDEFGRWSAQVEGVLHANPWFSILQQAVRRPDGSVGTHYTVHHARPAVGIVARENDRFLLIRQHRFIIDQLVWAIPSGNIEPGESAVDAAARELLEETGLEASSLRPLIHYFPTYGCSDQRFELFLADIVDPESAGAATLAVLMAGWATWGTINGRGPFTSESENEALFARSSLPRGEYGHGVGTRRRHAGEQGR